MRTSAVNSNSCTNSTNPNLSTQRTISDNSSSTVSSKYSTQSSHQPLPPPAQQQQPTHENIFGRIRKACLVKTKFSTSSVKHTAEAASAAIGGEQQQQQSTTRDSNQDQNGAKVSKATTRTSHHSSLHKFGNSTTTSTRDNLPHSKMLKSSYSSVDSATSTPPPASTGPVITGAVTKLPSTGINCSPSKQLLNSIFTTVNCDKSDDDKLGCKLNNQNGKCVASVASGGGGDKCVVTIQNNTQQQQQQSCLTGAKSPAGAFQSTEVSNLQDLDINTDHHRLHSSNSASSPLHNPLYQSNSHDSLLNLALRKKKKETSKNGTTNSNANNRHSNSTSIASIGNNSSIQLNNISLASDTLDLGKDERTEVITVSNTCNNLPSMPLSQSLPSSLPSQTPVTSSASSYCKRCYVRPSQCHHHTEPVCLSSSQPVSLTNEQASIVTSDLSLPRFDSNIKDSGPSIVIDQCSSDGEQLSPLEITPVDNQVDGSKANPPIAKLRSSKNYKAKCTCASSNTGSSTLKKLYNNIVGNNDDCKSSVLVVDNFLNNSKKNVYNLTSNLNDNLNNSKLYHKPFTLAKMRRSISKDSIDEKYWEFDIDDYLKTSKNTTNRDANLKNYNHQYHNIYQYIVQIQKEKQDLQNQLVELFRTSDSKRHEVEHLKKEVKQLKERFKNGNKDDSGEKIDQTSNSEKNVKQNFECENSQNSAVKEGGSKLADPGEENFKTTDAVYDLQPGPSGLCPPVSISSSSLDWDKQSSSSVSELSVANLQDRINQMEETHYSTSEELQATLQELNDMQEQVAQLQLFNEQLELDKNLLLETLCAQTKKLEHSLTKIELMQKVILEQYNDDEKKKILSASEREVNLAELLRCCQAEKDELYTQKNELTAELEDLKDKLYTMSQEHVLLYEKFRLYEELYYKQCEYANSQGGEQREDLASKLAAQSDQALDAKCDQSAYSKTPNKLHAAKSLQEISYTNAGSFYSLDENNDTAPENSVDMLRFLVKQLQDSISHKESELKKLKDQVILMESEHKEEITKLDLQMKNVENRNKELNERNEELYQRLKSTEEAKIESEIRAQKNLDEKREIRNILEEKDRRLADLERKLSQKCKELSEIGDKMSLEQAEWKQFQRDLLTTVRVANDFKQETLAECKKLQFEKHVLEEKLIALENELHKFRNDNKKLQFSLRSSVPASDSTPTANTTVVASVTSSPVKLALTTNSSDINNNGVPSVVGKPSLVSSPKSSPILTMRTQSYEPNGNQASTRPALSRSNSSQISVRSLIESIESHSKQIQQQQQAQSTSISPICSRSNSVPLMGSNSPHEIIQRHIRQALVESANGGVPNGGNTSTTLNSKNSAQTTNSASPAPILKDKQSGEKSFMTDILTSKMDSIRPRSTFSEMNDKKDPLAALVRGGGSKRNALLKWCKNKSIGYRDIDITNFSSSWNDGLAFCAILHTYLPKQIPYETLTPEDKKRNFTIAFKAAESVGIPTTLDLNEMLAQERPDWHKIMAYVTSIFTHFET